MRGLSRSVARLSVSSQQGGAASCRAAVCPPPRPAAAPASAGRPQRVGLRPCWGRRSVSRGPAALQTRRRAHTRSFPARSRPSDGHRHPKPCAAPPCSSRCSCGAASRRTAQGLPRGGLRPARSVAVSGAVGQSPAQRATAPPPAMPGVPDGKDSPRTKPIRRAPTLQASEHHPQRRFLALRGCDLFLFRCYCASDGQRRKISYEGPHGSGCAAYPKISRRRKIPPTCPFFAAEAPHKPKPAQRVIST